MALEFLDIEPEEPQEPPKEELTFPARDTTPDKFPQRIAHLEEETLEQPFTPPEFDLATAKADPIKEMASRILCRRRLMPFIKRFRPKYDAGWAHEDICRRLESFIQAVEQGLSPRMLIMCPPRFGKSEIGSRHFAPWALGRHPEWEIIAASHTSSLTLSFSRYVRDLLRDPAYKAVFADTALDPSSQSIENWNLTKGGGYLAAGVGTGITGRGAHILLLDDLVKDIEAADSPVIRDNTWEWYASTAYTRLAPGGGVLGIMCMTGDTPVMMADGSCRRLDTLTPSDRIATYARGTLAATTVAAVKSNGRDLIYKITMRSGKIVRANQRHPFLTVAPSGELSWTRLRHLTTALKIVTVKGSGVNGEALRALPRGVNALPSVAGFAKVTMPRSAGQTATDQGLMHTRQDATHASNTATESQPPTTTPCTKPKVDAVLFVESQLKPETHPVTGRTNSPSITATTPVRSEDCSVTTAMQESDTLLLSQWHLPPLSTSDFTLDEIVSIEPDGEEEVFDVQVDDTENFIANGLVSHNTWWHENDWAGRIQEVMASGEGDTFEIVRYPAINEEGDEYILHKLPGSPIIQYPPGSDSIPNDAQLVRPLGTAIHPARYTTEMMKKIKANLVAAGQKRIWQSLYQQDPTPDDGLYFTKDMFQYYTTKPPRNEVNIFQAWDFAITEGSENDYTVGTTIAQDHRDNLYILDVRRFKTGDGDAIIDTILDYYAEFDADLLGFEDGQIWKSLQSFFERRCEDRHLYPPYEILKPLTDKLVRAQPLRGRMQGKKVFFDKHAPWYDALRQELTRFPAGKHDDQCFIAGTAITMIDGRTRPIEDLRVGDMVATRDGPRPVVASALTHHATDVMRLELSNGRVLIGTGNHPIFTSNRGWVSLDSLTVSDILQPYVSQAKGESSCQGFISKLRRTLIGLSSTERPIVATLTHLGNTLRDTSADLVVEASCTATFGNSTTALFPPNTKYTTSMETTSTTTSQTLSAYHEHSTRCSIPKNAARTGARINSKHISRLSEIVQKSGTLLQKVWRGIARMQRTLGRSVFKNPILANTVVSLSSLRSSIQSFVRNRAGTKRGEKPTLNMKRRSVLAQKHAVYNLTVADSHTYFANGVLVHNCDSLSWCVRLSLLRRAPRDATPQPAFKSWKDKLRLMAGQSEYTGRDAGHMSA